MQLKVTRRKLLATAGLLILAPSVSHGQTDWRSELGTFRIGMLDSEAQKLSPGELERIRAAYADALRMPVEIMRARDLPALIDALVSSRVDYAMLTAAAYASASLVCSCVEPLVNAVMADGSTGTRTVLIADETLALASVTTSKGIAFTNRDAFNTYGVALAGLATSLPAFTPGATFLVESGSPEAVLSDFSAGKADALLTTIPNNRKAGQELAKSDPVSGLLEQSGRKVKVAWVSEPVPNGPHAVRQSLAAEPKQLLTDFLTGLATRDPDLNDMLLPEGAVSFGGITHADFAMAIRAAKALAGSKEQTAP